MTESEPKRRRYLVTGILDRDSIAWHVAKTLIDSEADVVATSFGRTSRLTRRAVAELGIREADVLDLDATKPEDFLRIAHILESDGRGLDGVVHSMAFASAGLLGGEFFSSSPAEIEESYRISVISFQQLIGALLPLLSESPNAGSVIGFTVDSTRALRGYDWMGVHKAALEAAARYAALYSGTHGVRVNLIAAGPLRTFSSVGVPTFDEIVEAHREHAPLGWEPRNHSIVAEAAVLLLSPAARGVTGHVLHVDGGFHLTTPSLTG